MIQDKKSPKIDYKRLYDALYENNLSMHFTVDKEFCLIAVNGLGAENLGYKPQEMILQKFINFIHPQYHKNVIEQLNYCIDNPGQLFQWEFKMTRRDGEAIWVKDRARTIESRNPKNILISCEDITVRKQAERSLDEIIKSYKIESLSRLAGGIAHDFNNLLTGILGNLSLIKANLNENDISYEKIIEIENTSIMAKDLAEQLFVFSTGGETYKTTLSVRELLKESLDFVLKDSDVTFEMTAENSFDKVRADSEQIKQVVGNIILNAYQAMAGSGKISIDLKDVAVKDKSSLPLDKGDYIEISIKDEGVGISKEDLFKVFDPYYSTKSSAAGLGLSTAETIIKNHNGHIRIESLPEVETTVHIYLPVFHDIEAETEPQADKQVEYDTRLLSGKRVLVMDDEQFIRKVAGNILEHLGCIVDFAKEGNEAIEKYKTSLNTDSPFDFVILYLTVGDGLGGEETLKQLIKIDPEVKAFVSSGYFHDPVMVNYKDYGFVGVINKPYEIEDFIKSFCDPAEKGST